MPPQQTIMWTALPNGFTSGGDKLQLSVFVSPRLQTDTGLPRPQLSPQFPDFVTWTAKAQGLQFAVQFEGGSAIAAAIVGPQLEPDLWTAVVKATTYVEPYQPPDYSGNLVYSHPMANVDTYIKGQYQAVGATSPTTHPPTSVLAGQLAPISLYGVPAVVSPPVQTGVKRGEKATAPKPVSRPVLVSPALKTFVSGLAPHVQLSATRNINYLGRVSAPMSAPAEQALQSIYQDLQQYRAVRTTPNPQPMRDFLRVRMQYPRLDAETPPIQPPDLDFHKLLSILGNYPELMRRLGLVFDLEVPIPPAGANTTVKVIPTWGAASPPSAFNTDFSAKTACTLDLTKKLFFATPQSASSNLVGGMLNLSDPNSYSVHHVDVAGSALKMINLADRLNTASSGASSSATAKSTTAVTDTSALPALRTAGVSLAQANRADWLASNMVTVAQKNKAVAANTPDQVTNYAEDLVRGYRVDVWDDQSKSWHTLCLRNGIYNFFAANLTRPYNDEGFVQLGVTQQTGPTPGSNAPNDFYLTESMFTWQGWSLSAPRPGKTIARDGTSQNLDDPATAQSRASSDFPLVVSFQVPSGTLPRLRFGTTYRIRARVADLAGNGPHFNDPSPTDFSTSTAPNRFVRFEPVIAPLAVLTKGLDVTKSPGESVYNAVIRSNYNQSAADYAGPYGTLVSDPNYSSFALRLIAPPRTSELMAERLGMFDSPSMGPMMGDQATYQMIAGKAEGAFPLDPLTRWPVQSALSIPYLPDPLCQGASLVPPDSSNSGVGAASPVSFYPTGNAWPGAVPFLLKVVEATANPSWQWDEGGRTLTLALAKAQVVTLNLSSRLGDSDSGTRNQQMMGVWGWIQDGAPKNLADLRASVSGGLHWMITPSRPLVVAHVVQQPLIAPQFHSLSASRYLKETFAYIIDDQAMPIDGKSTVKVDFEAAWQEPLDDVNDPSGPKTLNGTAHVGEWKIDPDQTKLQIVTSVALVQGPPSAQVQEKAPLSTAIHNAPEVKSAVPLPVATGAKVTESSKVTVVNVTPRGAVNAGTKIPMDVRRVRPGEALPAPQQFGYSWRHDFGDTKYRKVNYTSVATTRFAEYFPITDPTQLTRSSPSVAVDVPNSARPPLPKVLYVIPTFGWEKRSNLRVATGDAKVGELSLPTLKGTASTSTRSGGGLRVYLDRPWYLSGDGELLGVALWPSPVPVQVQQAAVDAQVTPAGGPQAIKTQVLAGQSAKAAPPPPPPAESVELLVQNFGPAAPGPLATLVTQWGKDPLWKTSPLPSDLPKLENFKNPIAMALGVTLGEVAGQEEPTPGAYRVCLAGYAPQYDKDRGLWFCDIPIDSGSSYFPFIRLALVRFQPISVEDAYVSGVVRADFAQLAPGRSATVVWDPANPKVIDVAVAGLSFGSSAAGAGPSVLEVSIESKPTGADPDLGWVPVPSATISVPSEADKTGTLWHAQIPLERYKVPQGQDLRLVIREYENFLADAPGTNLPIAAAPAPQPVRRLVYADVLSIPPLS